MKITHTKEQNSSLKKNYRKWAYLILISIIWGSSFILMKRSLNSFDAFQVSAFRMFFAFIGFLPFVFKYLKKLTRKNLIFILEVAFIGNGFPAFLFAYGQLKMSSSMAGMLNSVVPFFTLLLGLFFFNIKAEKKQIIGVLIGLVGTVGLMSNNGNITDFNVYSWLIILAVLMYAFNLNIIKRHLPNLRGIEIGTLSFLFVGPVAGFYLLFSDIPEIIHNTTNALNLFYLLILGFFGSFAAVVIFNSLIQSTTALFASSVTYLIPIVAIAWGVFDNETISFFQIICISIIFSGVFLINYKKE